MTALIASRFGKDTRLKISFSGIRPGHKTGYDDGAGSSPGTLCFYYCPLPAAHAPWTASWHVAGGNPLRALHGGAV